MQTKDANSEDGQPVNTTVIHSVVGQVHTGSGDVVVQSFVVGSTISTKAELLAALREFKAELDASRRLGVAEEVADDAVIEVEAAEKEAAKDQPKPERIVKRLENAKALLLAGAGVATAAASAAAATDKLLPMIESAIQAVARLL